MTDILDTLISASYGLEAMDGKTWVERNGSTVPLNACILAYDEIERLRAALRAVLQVATDEYDGAPWQAIDLARRALENKP